MLDTKEKIDEALIKLDKQLLKLDTLLIDDNSNNNNIKMNDIRDIKKHILDIQIAINVLKHENKHLELNEQQGKLDDLLKNMNLLNEYNHLLLEHYETSLLNTISLINLIFLPLAVITGYFGMNFGQLGPYEKSKKGILTIKNPNIFVVGLMCISTVVVSLIYYLLTMHKY